MRQQHKGLRNKEIKIHREALHNPRNTIILIAILIATVAYTGGISPVGGVYQKSLWKENQHFFVYFFKHCDYSQYNYISYIFVVALCVPQFYYLEDFVLLHQIFDVSFVQILVSLKTFRWPICFFYRFWFWWICFSNFRFVLNKTVN